MKERPILFSGEMVKAILEGRKTQTRRVLKTFPCDEAAVKFPYPRMRGNCVEFHEHPSNEFPMWLYSVPCPYGQPGDRLWVRETLRRDPDANVWYYAAGKPEDWVVVTPENHTESLVWAVHKEGDTCVSIHMPRWASRITLEITKVRIERVNDISYADCRAEGVDFWNANNPKEWYAKLWNSINKDRGFGWEKNPWVWVLEFKRVEAA